MIVRLPKYLQKAGIISGGIFILMLILVAPRIGFVMSMDEAIENAFSNGSFGLGDLIMTIVSFLGSPIVTLVVTFILAFVLYQANLRIPAIWVLATVISGNFVGWILKHVVTRPRPVGHLSGGFSFPSGHSLGTFLLITIFFILIIPNLPTFKLQVWLGWGVFLFGLLLMESRMYLLDHNLTDVIAGASLGIAWVILTAWLYEKYARVLRDRIPFFEYDEI